MIRMWKLKVMYCIVSFVAIVVIFWVSLSRNKDSKQIVHLLDDSGTARLGEPIDEDESVEWNNEYTV